MKRNFVLLSAIIFAIAFSSCRTKTIVVDTKKIDQFRYELECAGNGVQGTYLVKVWSFATNPHVAAKECKKNAVHGVIFKGFMGENGCVSQKAIVNTGIFIYCSAFILFILVEINDFLQMITIE